MNKLFRLLTLLFVSITAYMINSKYINAEEINKCIYELDEGYMFYLTYENDSLVSKQMKYNSNDNTLVSISIKNKSSFSKNDFKGSNCPVLDYKLEYLTDQSFYYDSLTIQKGSSISAYLWSNQNDDESGEDGEENNDNPFDVSPLISEEVNGCSFYLGDSDDESSVSYLLQKVFTGVKIGAIVLFIIFAMLDFAKVITNDKDNLMVTVKKQVKRLIILIIVLLLPFFLGVIGDLINYDITCGIK